MVPVYFHQVFFLSRPLENIVMVNGHYLFSFIQVEDEVLYNLDITVESDIIIDLAAVFARFSFQLDAFV